MQLLPTGFGLPPVPYLLAVLVGSLLVGGLLYRRGPHVTSRVVASFTPWMVAGATGYALFQVQAVPAPVRPFFGNPVVYLTTFVLAGTVWLATADYPADRWGLPSVPGAVLATGTTVAGTLLAYAVTVGLARGTLSLFWPAVGLGVALVLAGVAWFGLRDRLDVAVTGSPGALVLVGHALDGVSTAVGTHLGYGEQTPLSKAVIDAGAALPVAGYLGEAWLFVVVKLVLAVGVLYLLADYVRDRPQEGALLLGFVAAVGLGPGVHNVVLFAIA
ncbi:DUF63 family protein [Halorarius halobius]|uniref:DUF63 family protein n=1 Tax=Halorarius halobius TaxID=2962671 RepID=UPI0020CF22E6|nr:DUF63 family protein [Halorarius halobius]